MLHPCSPPRSPSSPAPVSPGSRRRCRPRARCPSRASRPRPPQPRAPAERASGAALAQSREAPLSSAQIAGPRSSTDGPARPKCAIDNPPAALMHRPDEAVRVRRHSGRRALLYVAKGGLQGGVRAGRSVVGEREKEGEGWESPVVTLNSNRRGGGDTRTAPASITITPVQVAD